MTGRRASAGRRRRNRKGRLPFALAVLILVLAAILTIGIILLDKYHTYTHFIVQTEIQMGNSEENTEYYPYGKGYLKCAGDGLTYFTENGIRWSESYSMLQPVIDICGEYIAVADMGQRNIFLYDSGGFVTRLNLSHAITDVEVSRSGMLAAATNDDSINYIEIRDRLGNEIMTEKSVFSSSGFLMDLSLSEEGTRLAAVFVSISKGTLKSRVAFYDLSGGGESQDIIAGTFDDYDSVLLTTVQFMEKDAVCVAGDTAFSIYQFREEPELVYDCRDFPWEIQTLFFSDSCIGMVVEETQGETRYCLKVFDTAGQTRLSAGVDFPYGKADFAGENVILYSYLECLMYSLSGIEKMHLSFDDHIEALKSKDGRHFVYGTNTDTRFITLQ